MDLLEKISFNKWAYYMYVSGYIIVGYIIEPFIIGIPMGMETEKEDDE